jgi:DNA repair photolyase
MIVTEIQSKSILSTSKLFPYVINPYRGCQHACSYCYARFMQKYSGHKEPWGQFVDVKVNAPDLLQKEIRCKTKGRVWISGVCDPYQPLEERYQLTRRCLEILVQNGWPVTLLTRSPLIVRDLDLLKQGQDWEAGCSVTTADDRIRQIFEPQAPPISARLQALDELHQAGIKTFAMIAPLLPGAEGLVEALTGKVERVVLDGMNYHYADWVYRKYNLVEKMSPQYFRRTQAELAESFSKMKILV